MNGFEKHGLKHSSASQVNMWEECPAAWVARYLYNKKFKFGVAPQIGILTEDVVTAVLMGSTVDKEVELAENKFNKKNALNVSEKDLNRVHDIRPMAEHALEVLKPYGEPEFLVGVHGPAQQKINVMCKADTFEIPIIGYLDYVFPKHGLVIDLKTTQRCPSSMSGAHARQAAIYAQAKGNMGVKFLYVTPKKSNVIDLEDKGYFLNQVKNILQRKEKVLNAFDKEGMREVAHLSLGSFYWNGDEKIREELYGV